MILLESPSCDKMLRMTTNDEGFAICDLRFAICDLNRQLAIKNRQSKIGNWQSKIGNPKFVILLAFALRVFRLDAQSLWYDEAFSVYLAHFDLATIAARTAADIQPPLYYALLHFWIALAGDSEFALRFLSLVFGVTTVPLAYVTARRLFDVTSARLAALLVALAPLYVWYAQEARMYTLITFLLLLASYALWRALDEPARATRWWIVFTLANIAAAYTHYFAFVVIAFQFLWVLVSGFRLLNLKLATLALVAILVAFLPWMPFVIARFGQDASYWRGALKLDEALRHILINFTLGESVLEHIAQPIALGWLIVLLIGLFTFIRDSKFQAGIATHPLTHSPNHRITESPSRPIIFLILYLIIPLALLLVLFSRNPKFNARYLMIASPAFYLLLAAGMSRLTSHVSRFTSHVSRFTFHALRITHYALRNTFPLLTFSFLLLTSTYAVYNIYFDPAFTKASFRDVARYIEQHIAPDEAIILTSGHLFPAFHYYYRGDAPTLRLPDEPTLNTERVLGYETARVLNETLAGKRGVWVVLWQDEVVDPNGFVPMLLASRGVEQKLEPTNFYHVRLRHWRLDPNARWATEPEPRVRREANFQNRIQLIGYDAPAPMPADVGASFNLYWRVLDTLDDDYQIALRVVDAAGNLWGKQDRRPAGYTYPATRWKRDEYLFGAYTVPLLAGTPAGDYFVRITFYTQSNPSGLDVLAPNGAPIGKAVTLGPIPVLPATQPAAFASLNIPNTISQPMPPFTLLGYHLPRDRASAGETIPLTLFWRADTRPTRDDTLRVQFGDALGEPFPLANLQFPTTLWRAGEIVRGQYAVAIPAHAREGMASLRIVLSDGQSVDLAPFTIEKTDRVFVAPNAQFAQRANFGNVIALVGYDVPTLNVKPGETVRVTLYWQARAKMDKSYTVFVHLLDAAGKVVAQQDAQPLRGARPTPTWVANEYLADAYELVLKPETPSGAYRIEIGWYDAADPAFARVPVLDDNGVAVSDHVILQTIIQVK
jgi:4-amino-4-deoxy-L-arabinose transferase-like glycosyltransferase